MHPESGFRNSSARFLFIAVSYRTPESAQKYFDCFSRDILDSGDVVLILVDNSGCEEESVASHSLAGLHPSVHYVVPPRNLGYLGGARYGLSLARTMGIAPNWTVVSNVDLRFDATELTEVVTRYDHRRIGVVAPAIRSAGDGTALNPYMIGRPSRLRLIIYKHVFRHYWGLVSYSFLSSVRRRLARLRRSRGAQSEGPASHIYAPHGCLIIFAKGYFDRGATLEHRPFLFYEELTIAEAARTIGLPVVYEPAIHVEHFDHASTSALPGRVRHRYVSEAAAYVADELFATPRQTVPSE